MKLRETIGAMKGAFARFLSWWLGELVALVPQWLHRALTSQRDAVVFSFVGDRVTIEADRGDDRDALGTLDLDGTAPALDKAAVAALLDGLPLKKMAVAARLPADQVLHTTIELPITAERNLDQALRYQLEMRTGFKPAEVYFDYRVLSRDVEAKRLTADLVVAPRDVVDGPVARLDGWGLKAGIVDVGGADGGDGTSEVGRFNFVRERQSESSPRRFTVAHLALGVVLVGLAAAAVAIPLQRLQANADALSSLLVRARADADVVARLEAEIARLHKDRDFLVESKRKTVSVTVLLKELTELIPDGSWLFQMQVKRDEIVVQGYSPDSSSLIGPIEKSPYFRSAVFKSQVTRIAKSGLDRFQIAIKIAADGS